MLTQEEIQQYLNTLAENQAKMNTSGPTLARPQDGVHTYRILPDWRTKNAASPSPYVQYARHWVKGINKGEDGRDLRAVTLCSKHTYGQQCPVCATYWKVKGMNPTKEIESLLSQSNASTKFVVNALHRSGSEPEKVIQLELPYKVGVAVFGDGKGSTGLLTQWMNLTRVAFPLDLAQGTDVIIRRSGSGRNTTYSVELPSTQSAPVNPAVLNELVDLEALIAQWQHTPEEEAQAIDALNEFAAVIAASQPQSQASNWAQPQQAPQQASNWAQPQIPQQASNWAQPIQQQPQSQYQPPAQQPQATPVQQTPALQSQEAQPATTPPWTPNAAENAPANAPDASTPAPMSTDDVQALLAQMSA